MGPLLAASTQKLLDRFRRQRARADRCLDELDASAQAVARCLLAEGLTMRQVAPLMSADDFPVTHPMVAYARDGGRSRRPWRGRRRKGS